MRSGLINSLRKLLIVTTLFAVTNLQGQSNINAEHINTEKGIGAGGYDLTLYFTQQQAVEGDPKFSASVGGITYYFASITNKNKFEKNPELYLPAYGGWCAYAMGNTAEKVEVDPETFKIINGKLYLFYNFYFNNTLKSWNMDESNLKKKADSNWQHINN